VRFLDLSRQTAELGDELCGAIRRALDESAFVLGKDVERFERAFADYCGARHAVGVASGADALAIALAAVGVQPGDEVVTAANTCLPTVAAIERAGATPVLADVDPATLTLDPDAAAAAVTTRTRALVPVHLYGQCADMRRIGELARDRGLKVVEDAAHAHGAEYDGRRAGTLGDAAAFSFYPTKNLGALGDGGAVVTDDDGVADRIRAARSYGDGAGRSIAARAGSSRLDTVQAAVLLAKLRRLDDWNDRRRELARRYAEALAAADLVVPAEAPGRRHVYHLFAVRSRDRIAFRSRLGARGIETLVHYAKPVHAHAQYAALARPGTLTESEAACAEVTSLPLYPELTDEEAEAVIDAVTR
jgi:dTDP-4-amino-4,6-dideoxygalactose transaminase